MEVWGTLGRSGNSLRWGNPLIHIVSLEFDQLSMIGAVTRRMLPHLSGVHFLQVNRPYKGNWEALQGSMLLTIKIFETAFAPILTYGSEL